MHPYMSSPSKSLRVSPVPDSFETFLSRIESPALLAVALLWHEARGKRRMPSWDDLPSDALSPHAKLLWGFAYDPETGLFTVQLAGDRLKRWTDQQIDAGSLEDIRTRANHREIRKQLTRIITTPLVYRSSGRLFKVGDLTITGERICLPLAKDGKTGDAMLGASDYVSPPLLGPSELILENQEWYAP